MIEVFQGDNHIEIITKFDKECKEIVKKSRKNIFQFMNL
jgi:hypothetical protein